MSAFNKGLVSRYHSRGEWKVRALVNRWPWTRRGAWDACLAQRRCVPLILSRIRIGCTDISVTTRPFTPLIALFRLQGTPFSVPIPPNY